MSNQIERIKNVTELNHAGDLSDSESIVLINKILGKPQETSTNYSLSIKETKVIGNRRNSTWTEDENRLLQDYIQKGYKFQTIANLMHRSKDSIRTHISILNNSGKPERNFKRWSEDDVQTMKSYINKGYTYVKIAKLMNKTVDAIRIKNSRLKTPYHNSPFSVWNDSDTQELIRLRNSGMKLEDIAKHFNVKQRRVENKIYNLKKEGKWHENTTIKQIPTEDERIQLLIGKGYSNEKIAMKLGKPKSEIENKRNQLPKVEELPYRPSKPLNWWEDDETLELIKLYEQGKRTIELAKILKRSTSQIRNKLHNLKAAGGFQAWKEKHGYADDWTKE